jgi:hypothetical protein
MHKFIHKQQSNKQHTLQQQVTALMEALCAVLRHGNAANCEAALQLLSSRIVPRVQALEAADTSAATAGMHSRSSIASSSSSSSSGSADVAQGSLTSLGVLLLDDSLLVSAVRGNAGSRRGNAGCQLQVLALF